MEMETASASAASASVSALAEAAAAATTTTTTIKRNQFVRLSEGRGGESVATASLIRTRQLIGFVSENISLGLLIPH